MSVSTPMPKFRISGNLGWVSSLFSGKESQTFIMGLSSALIVWDFSTEFYLVMMNVSPFKI